jgi:OHCU decarboxylase
LNIEAINSQTLARTCEELLKCCGSRRWAERLAEEKPFASSDEIKKKAKLIWWSLSAADWLEAFRSHPKIGERKAAEPVTVEARKWSEQEQSGVSGTPTDILAELAELNRLYEEKFGYIFIVCASGKSTDELLTILRERLRNEPETELPIAAAEQARITDLRIEKLLNQ